MTRKSVNNVWCKGHSTSRNPIINPLLVLLFLGWNLPAISQTQSDIVLQSLIRQDSGRDMDRVIKIFSFDTTNNDAFANYLLRNERMFFSRQMKSLHELPIDSIKKGREDYQFRIVCLPSFTNPVCFTLRKKGSQYYLYWKIGSGAGGYEPKGVKKSAHRKMPPLSTQYFLDLVDLKSRDTVPVITYSPMNDGTSWLSENNLSHDNKVSYTNMPDDKLMDCFALFVHLSKCKIESDNIYKRYFDKNDRIINIDALRNRIFDHLKKNKIESVLNDDICINCGLQIGISANEKVSSVRYIPEEYYQTFADRVDDWYDSFKDRKHLRKVKQILETVNLSYLNLDEKILIQINLTYNKENKALQLDKE